MDPSAPPPTPFKLNHEDFVLANLLLNHHYNYSGAEEIGKVVQARLVVPYFRSSIYESNL